MSHVRRIIEALEKIEASNKQPSVDDPQNDFEKAVNEWSEIQDLQAEIKSLMKPLADDEREARNGISDSLRTYFGSALKEGMNNYPLSNRRKLKFTNKIQRSIDIGSVAVAREFFEKADNIPDIAFDDLLRVGYELVAAPFKKVQNEGGQVSLAVSKMLVSKFAAPTLVVD